jgi:hypothetical protein
MMSERARSVSRRGGRLVEDQQGSPNNLFQTYFLQVSDKIEVF